MHSQDIYHLKYKSPDVNDTATYAAFFSLSADGTGIVRVKPVHNNNLTVEMTFQEQYAMNKEGMPDTTKLVYPGMDPVIVKGDTNTKFVPVIFWFKINKDNLYDPWAVTAVSEKSDPSESNLISADFIKIRDLGKNETLVAGFFANTSAYYKNIFVNARGSLSTDETKNIHMYLVVVASTKDPTLSTYALNDAKRVITLFAEISKFILGLPDDNFHLETIYGENYSRASVEEALKKLPATNKNNNLVIFYYSGHGFHDKNKPEKIFPFFDLRDPRKRPFRYKDTIAQARDLETNSLNVQDIYNSILAKGNRFNLVLSDCCNDTVAAPKKLGLRPPGHKGGPPKPTIANVRALFMNKQPVNLLMTAASKDEEAIVTLSFNSYFTYNFRQSLIKYLTETSFPTWKKVFDDAKSQTSKQVSLLPCEEKNKCPKQTPRVLEK